MTNFALLRASIFVCVCVHAFVCSRRCARALLGCAFVRACVRRLRSRRRRHAAWRACACLRRRVRGVCGTTDERRRADDARLRHAPSRRCAPFVRSLARTHGSHALLMRILSSPAKRALRVAARRQPVGRATDATGGCATRGSIDGRGVARTAGAARARAGRRVVRVARSFSLFWLVACRSPHDDDDDGGGAPRRRNNETWHRALSLA